MRALFLAALLIVSPALADDWQRYENTTYGYSIDIPPGLLWRGESYEGDGQDFTTPTLTLSLKGKHLELEGILPEPTDGAVPNQGRLGVFLAKENIRLHRGEIHAGPGLEGTEILVSLRSW